MKLLIISDVHYPVGSISEIKRIIAKERPDNLALLGDNIDGPNAVSLYKKFMSGIAASFPAGKTILMLGDGDYLLHDKKDQILRYANSLKTMNREHLTYRKGNMVFSHGNVERSRRLEGIGKRIVLFSVSKRVHGYIPFLVGLLARISLRVRRGDYLFLGHLHLLGKSTINRTTFCGTLNRRARFFADRSLGYVVVKHEGFIVQSMDDIKVVSIKN